MKCENWITDLALEVETAVYCCYCIADVVGRDGSGMSRQFKIILYCNCFIPFLTNPFPVHAYRVTYTKQTQYKTDSHKAVENSSET